MWRDVAPLLAERFAVVCADLPGQGQSGPVTGANAFSKRAMGDVLVDAMLELGYSSFGVAGHDRGGRVAYRMAFDHPAQVARVVVLDIIPIVEALENADDRMLTSFWSWSLLAQPAPLPERLIAAAPEAVVDDAVTNWGTLTEAFPDDVRKQFTDALRDTEHVHAVCEEFRAAVSIDREHDDADRDAGRKITQPLLVLWDAKGALAKWYEDRGGPLGIWRDWAVDVTGEAVQGGHFFPEAEPVNTADRLRQFFV